VTSSLQFDLAPARATVRVFAHELRANRVVPCFSYVTNGLRAFGQKEIVLTLVRPQNAEIQHAPRDPLALLRTIAGLAQQGRLVDEGGITEVGDTGLFGRPHIRGVAYQTAWPMDGVTLPPECLAAIALVGPEMEIAKRFGALRILSRLGRANGFFPTAPWCELDRAPLASADEKSILENVARVHIGGASAVLANDRVVVRLPHSARSQFESLPPLEIALTIFTTLDAHADACLVWTPGQKAPEAISAPRSKGLISGCFALFVPQQSSDGANPFEDGFAVTLTDQTWTVVRHALSSETNATIAGNRPLSIEWYEPVKAQPQAPPASEMAMHIREAQADIDARIGMQTLVSYANAIESAVQKYFANRTGRGMNLDLDVLLAAGRPPAIRIYCTPEIVAALAPLLASLPAPPIRDGEIAFRGSFALFGGAS